MDVFLRICTQLLFIIQYIYDTLVKIFGKTQRKNSVPECVNPVLRLSASVLAEKIRKREITSEKIVESYIKRIGEVNPIINAIVEERFADALKDARKVDEFLAANGSIWNDLEKRRPLLGIPVTIKESIALKGLSYTGCSKTREGMKAQEDSDVVALLKEAGAIPLLVSNTPEYCVCLETDNKITGYTYNPYNTLYTSGGSSGGEGALIGAGASLVGTGSDIAGSIRLPAAFNGVFGHKPTSGIVSLKGHFPYSHEKEFSEYLVIGPLTRYAEDLRLMLKVMAGKNATKLNLDRDVDLSKIKVFFMEDSSCDLGLRKVDKDVKIAIKEAVMYLSRNFHCTVTDRKFEGLANSLELVSATIFRMKNIPNMLKDSETKYCFFGELFKSLFGKSTISIHGLLFFKLFWLNRIGSINYKKYTREKRILRETLMKELGEDGVLIYPSYPTGAHKRGGFLSSSPGSAYSCVFNCLGFPATCIPVGFDKNGMPIGIQVVAAPYQDRLGLAVATELEKCFGGWQSPC